MVVRRSEEGKPSGVSESGCRWGSSRSSSSKKSPPSTKPPAAGTQPGRGPPSAISMAGISSDQTEAAIITPAANPRKLRWNSSPACLRKKKTIPAPAAVARKVKPVPSSASKTGL